MPKTCKVLPKWRNFAKSGHTAPKPFFAYLGIQSYLAGAVLNFETKLILSKEEKYPFFFKRSTEESQRLEEEKGSAEQSSGSISSEITISIEVQTKPSPFILSIANQVLRRHSHSTKRGKNSLWNRQEGLLSWRKKP